MPIKGLTDRGLAFPEIGQIRKGAPKGEKAPGKDLTFFRVTFDEREQEAAAIFKRVYGDQPTEIRVILPFDEIDRMWDAWMEAYTAGRLVARSDGERFVYLVDTKTGEVKVKNGLPYTAYTEGQIVGYDYQRNPVKCKPAGRLKVIIPELARAAYMTVLTTSVHDIANLSAQLEAFKQLNHGRIAGIPLVLRRRPKKISMPKKDGQRARVTKWMLSIEADPEWVKAMLTEVKRAALPGNGLALLPEPQPAEPEPEFEEGQYTETDEEDDIPSQPEIDAMRSIAGDVSASAMPPEPEDPPDPPEYEQPATNGAARPYSPEVLRERISAFAVQFEDQKTKAQDRNMVAANLELCFAGQENADKIRHSVLKYLTGHDSTKDISDAQVLALKKWLNAKPDDGGAWHPDPMAVREANSAWVAALEVAGQHRLL